jgi:hypothetical protein
MDYTNATGVDIEPGQLVPIETANKTFVGIAVDKIANGEKGVLIVSDIVVTLPKVAGAALSRGGLAAVGTAGTTIRADTSATETISNAFVWEDAAADATECKLALR